uniref:Uncharacterized protein n=1 Tax=Solanum tuberosum TaxID=4113 RepID=M0ZHU2_SOLTU
MDTAIITGNRSFVNGNKTYDTAIIEGDDIVAKKLLATSNTFVLVFFVIAIIYLKCWAFEVVPFLQKKYKVFSKQESSLRIFRWLLATNNESVNINEFFDPPQDSEVEEHLLQLLREFLVVLVMEEEFTPKIDRCTDGVDFERGGDFGDISGGFGVGTSSPIDENVPCLQETPSTKETIDLLNVRVKSLKKTIVTMNAKIESLEKTIVTMKSKRGIWPSSKISHPYTPDYVKRTKRQISVALSSARKKKKGKVNETIIEKELMSRDSKDEGADSNSKKS